MTTSPLRYKRLLRELPKHKHAKDALIASGFPITTANKQAKRVLQSAIKHQAREILAQSNTNAVKGSHQSKQLMSDLVGLSGEELFMLIKKIANQDKDYGSALKVIAPLVREHGVLLSTDDESSKVTVPILNITVDKTPQTIEDVNKDSLNSG